jgi:ankyrin repeat protein
VLYSGPHITLDGVGSELRVNSLSINEMCFSRRSASVHAVDSLGATPLKEAAGRGQAEVAQALIEHGADLNARAASGATPLEEAIRYHRTKVIEALLAKGARQPGTGESAPTSMPTIRSQEPRRSSMGLPGAAWRRSKRRPTVAPTRNCQNGWGQTPLETARENDHRDVGDLLRIYPN